jgi:ABC-type Mn2+/Zn2+ transport system permease subunit
MGSLFEPFKYEFFRNGVAVATVAGALCGLIGVYVVLRGMSYIGHGLSHSIFGGFALSTLVGINPFLGAGVWGFGSALATTAVTNRRKLGADAAIGVITTASYAMGIVAFKLATGPKKNFDAAVFGSILGTSRADVARVLAVTVLASVVIFFRYRALLFNTFDPDVAEVMGVNKFRIDALLMLVLASAILVTMNVIGVTLVAATLVIPASIARLLVDSFPRLLALSTGIGAFCGFAGMLASWHLKSGSLPSGPLIVLVSTVLFGLAFVVSSRKGRVGHVH